MKKFVNVRPLVIIALTVCAGIFTGVALYFCNFGVAWIFLAIVPAAFIACIWIGVKRKIVKPLIIIFLPLALFLGGALNAYYSLVRFDDSEIVADRVYAVHGTVKEMGETANGEYIIIGNITADGKKIKGKAYVYLSSTYGELCDVGYTVDFYSDLQKVEPFQYGKLVSSAEENIKYRASVFAGLKSTYGYSFFGSIRAALHNNLYTSLDGETAAITYAMLTGNTHGISEESLSSFRYGGVAHIFAVSGLHIGLVFAILSTILKKSGAHKYVRAVICIGAVFLYTAICGFALSALRAAIMCTVTIIAEILQEKYDGLNSLAIAVIIILSITPLSMFSVGFQLSACAVGGIFCLSKCIEKSLTKIKIPRKIGSAVGASLGAQFGTLPIMLTSFGYLSGAGLLLNLIVLPILSIEFSVLFCCNFLCLIVPAAAPYLLPYATLPLEFIMSVFIGAGFEKALLSGFGAGAFVGIYYVGILALSDKINLKPVARIIALLCTALFLLCYAFVQFNLPFTGYSLIISAYNSGGEVLIKSQNGRLLIVTDDVNTSRLKSMLNKNYAGDIDAVIILGEDSPSTWGLLQIDCKDVYLWNEFEYQPYGNIILKYEESFEVCGVSCTFLDRGTLLAEVGGVKIGVCAEENTLLNSCDILISDDSDSFVDCGVHVLFNSRANYLNIFDCGDIKFEIDDGKFKLKNKIPFGS